MDKLFFQVDFFWHWYILIFLLLGLFYLPIYKNYCYNIFDPLFFSLIFNQLAISTCLYLVIFNITKIDIPVISLLLSDIFFWIGFVVLAPTKLILIRNISQVNYSFNLLTYKIPFFICFTIFILFKFLQYYNTGLPFLYEGIRTQIYLETKTSAIYSVIANSLVPIIAYYCFIFIDRNILKKSSLYAILMLLLLSILFEGEKSAVLYLISLFFIVKIIFNNEKKELYQFFNFKNFCIIIFLFFLGVIFFFAKHDFISSIKQIAERFFNYGDIYYIGFHNEAYEKIDINENYFISIIEPLLATSKIIEWKDISISYGAQLNSLFYNNYDGSGPNLRLNFFNFLYFGNFAFIPSFIIGLIVGYFRLLLAHKKYNLLILYLSFTNFYCALILIVDIQYSFVKLFTSYIGILIFWLFLYMNKSLNFKA